ncbi:MAG TPA: AAA family ATPase, partial [Methylococcaceae bacterium]|nr:AAA family ATPase [Methylococcaceae bacterium]
MTPEDLKMRAKALHLHGLLAHWDEIKREPWVPVLIQWEEDARQKRSLERRIKAAKLGRFKMMAQFDWNWPKVCDRGAIENLMGLDFIREKANIIFMGPNGIGKTMIAKNLTYESVVQGHTALYITASEILGDLASITSDALLKRRLSTYARVDVLVIDEVGYLSYGDRHADLLFNLINRRYEEKSTIVTSNRPFSEWKEVFPNASCVVA